MPRPRSLRRCLWARGTSRARRGAPLPLLDTHGRVGTGAGWHARCFRNTGLDSPHGAHLMHPLIVDKPAVSLATVLERVGSTNPPRRRSWRLAIAGAALGSMVLLYLW